MNFFSFRSSLDEFFSWHFPLHEFFFGFFPTPPPPHHFSNGPSLIVMYRNLYPKSSFCFCPYTVLVKCPVRFYSIFDEIGQNVDGKMYFYHRSHCSTTTTESIERQPFQFTCAREGYARKNCAERFSALNILDRITMP